jgi:outer membrane protein assembly factor BamB
MKTGFGSERSRRREEADHSRKRENPPPHVGGYFIVSFAGFLLAAQLSLAEDWPAYRHDLRRSAMSQDQLVPSLQLQWVFTPLHPPKPAWPMPSEETPRMHTDRALHVIVAGDTAYFGSSTDHQVYALDAATGDLRWTFFTEGPVRFAPAFSEGRLFFGSDDGLAYCLDANNGKLIWKFRPSVSNEHVIGNGNMISLWPIQTGLVVDRGIVYLAAGVFPYEGLYVCAVDATSGKEIWKNDTVGDLAWGTDYGGMAPQGYLLASDEVLYVPSGRAMPAEFDRKTGAFTRFLSPGGKIGGSWALVEKGALIAGVNNQGDPAKVVYEEKSGTRKGDLFTTINGIDLVQTPKISYVLTESGILSIDREDYRHTTNELAKVAKKKKDLGEKVKEVTKKLKELKDKIAQLEPKSDAASTNELAKTRKENKKQLDEVASLGRQIEDQSDKEKKLEQSTALWTYSRTNLSTLALVGRTLVAGGDGFAVTVDEKTGKELWKTEVDGEVLGMAASQGRLFLSTDRGPIYCFAKEPTATPRQHRQSAEPTPFPNDQSARLYQSAAESILEQAGVTKGFCLVMNAGEGRLAYELAKRSQLKIVALESDPEKLKSARNRLNASGWYGTRIMVEPWDLADLPDYFANLIVSDQMIAKGSLTGSAEEMFRVLHPFGGVAIFGRPAGAAPGPVFDFKKWLANISALKPVRSSASGTWWKLTRGKLEGAGTWTSLYGNSANTGSSTDELVRGPLGVLWYGEPGSQNMPERHSRSVSPLAINGRLFMQGTEIVMAYDGYNGTQLWERKIPGAIRLRVDVDGGNLSATKDYLYVAANDQAYQLDAQTGETAKTFQAPSSPNGNERRWGYVAATDRQLFGTTAKPLLHEYGYLWTTLTDEGQWKEEDDVADTMLETLKALKKAYPVPDKKALDYFKRSRYLWASMGEFPAWGPDQKPSPIDDTMMISDSMFGYDASTGQLQWQYEGNRIPNISITMADNKIFFTEAETNEVAREIAWRERKTLIADGRYERHDEEQLKFAKRDIRRLTVLDQRTGKRIWSKTVDLSGCGGTKLGTAYQDGKLLAFGHYSNHDEAAFVKGSLAWRRISVFDALTGDWIWSKPLNYRRRPLIMGDTIYIEPRACSLATGKIKTRIHPITGETVPWEFLRPGHSCGIVTASPSSIFYRSYCAAIVDVTRDSGLTLFGSMRPGCWNNLIPANGVLNFQEASAGCTCSYSLRSTVVLKHKKQKEPGEWTVFVSQAPTTPVAHLAINFGAPGDLRDDAGTVWFAYPRPDTAAGRDAYKNYGIKFDLKEKFLASMGVFSRDFHGVQIEGSDQPWLFTSGLCGLKQCHVPLIDGQPPGIYKVRLGFLAAPGEVVGQRVFDIKLQDKEVLKNFDPVKEAGGVHKPVLKEFSGLRVIEDLKLELVPAKPNCAKNEAPVIYFLEAFCQDQPDKTTERRAAR